MATIIVLLRLLPKIFHRVVITLQISRYLDLIIFLPVVNSWSFILQSSTWWWLGGWGGQGGDYWLSILGANTNTFLCSSTKYPEFYTTENQNKYSRQHPKISAESQRRSARRLAVWSSEQRKKIDGLNRACNNSPPLCRVSTTQSGQSTQIVNKPICIWSKLCW